MWGIGNEGRIKSNGVRYFYLKDHLGSIRAVINQNNVVVQAQDYDPWGHIARTWDSTSTDYKFTGKERDKESSYDYFGARYYDARVGRWGQTEPLLEKYIQWSPYNYCENSPIIRIDFFGLDYYYYLNGNSSPVIVKNDGDDKYFVQHKKGNYSFNMQSINGENYYSNFFELNDIESINIYLEQKGNKGVYDENDVAVDFENQKYPELYKQAIPSVMDIKSSYLYAFEQSLPGNKMDTKQSLYKDKLYLFDALIYNYREAGNIVWGSTMFHLRFTLFESLASAHFYTYFAYGHFDQRNEQKAINFGWDYAEKNKFSKRLFPW